MSQGSSARARTLTLSGLALGAGLGLVAAAQPWWRATGEGVAVRFTGTQASAGLGQALALVVVVGTLLALVLAARGRRALAVLLLLVGAGVLVLGASRPRPSADAVRSEVRQVSLADQFALSATVWPWVYAGAGLVVAVAAGSMLGTASRWPQRTARFERTPGPVSPPATGPDDAAALWRSLDAGVDPTLDADAEHTLHIGSDPSEGVDVHESPSGDTMGPRAEVTVRPGVGGQAVSADGWRSRGVRPVTSVDDRSAE